MLHPNQENDAPSPKHGDVATVLGDGPKGFSESRCALWFGKLDETKFGPCLIRNYNKVRMVLDLAN
jgi:hypothetical protein